VTRAKLYPEGTIELKKIFSRPVWSRKYFLAAAPVLLLLAGGGWYWYREAGPRESLAARVPAAAVGYVEVASLSKWLAEVGETPTWRELAPVVGLDLPALARWGRLATLTGEPQLALLADAQLALVVTAIEVGDGELRPRLALLVETHRSDESAHLALEKGLGGLAGQLFGEIERREQSYAGQRVLSFHPRPEAGAASPERGLFASRMGSGWVVANHLEPLRQVLDAQLGRIPVMSGDFHWQQARRQLAGVAKGAETKMLRGIFGFVTGEGVTRLLRSGSAVIANGPVSRALLAGAVGDIVTDLAAQVNEGIAIHEEYGREGGVTRYSVMLKPDLVERLQSVVRPPADRAPSPALAILPPTLRTDPELEGEQELGAVTIYRVANPLPTLSQVEAAISARLGAAPSFLLHQFLIGVRETFLGIRDEALASAAIGDEIVEARYGAADDELLWLVAIRDRASMERLVDAYLTAEGAKISRREDGILQSDDPERRAATRIGDYLVLGQPLVLSQLAARPAAELSRHPVWKKALPSGGSPWLTTYEESSGPVNDLLAILAATGQLKTAPPPGDLPLTVRTVRLGAAGLEIESRHPLGNFPAIFGLLLGGQDLDQSGE